jgi:hypothetical protein
VALYMVIERFRNADAAPVYRQFRERGRMAPDGLNYISSWVTEDMSTCFQVMETANESDRGTSRPHRARIGVVGGVEWHRGRPLNSVVRQLPES